jgi:hypothetical protein
MQKIVEAFVTVISFLFIAVLQALLKTVFCYYIYLWAIYPYSNYKIEFWYMWGIVLFTESLITQYKSKD